MEVLAVVPARGGSQHVHYKNIAPVLGKPSLAHTLDHIAEARTVTRTVVSTEDEKIATAAREYGAEVLIRPAEFSTPDARLDHVLRHAVNTLALRDGYIPSIVLMLYAAVPVRPVGFIDKCVELMVSTGCDSVRSVEPVAERHPFWSIQIDDELRVHEYLGKMNYYRRQDLPQIYYYSGALCGFRTEALMNAPADTGDHFAYFGSDRRACVHGPYECIEIHEPIDIELAEFLLKRRQSS